jgi:hypothetical protein
MIRAEAEPLPEGTPGFGRIVVTGIATPPGGIAFTLRREGFAAGCLGPRGWQNSEEELRVERTDPVPEVNGWAIVIGPGLSRHLRPAPYLLGLPALGKDLPIFWPDTIETPVEDQDLTMVAPRQPEPQRWPDPPPRPPVVDRAPEPPPPVIEPERPRPPETPPPTPIWKKPWPWAVLGAVLVLVVAGVLLRDTIFPPPAERIEQAQPGQAAPPPAQPAPAQPAPAQPAPAQPAPAQPAAGSGIWPDGSDALALPDVVARAPDNAGIVAAAQRRQRAGRFDDALALYEEAASRGEAGAWFELARMYDPVGFVAGRPFRTPDGYQAARHYQEAERRGHAAAAAPRAALRTHLEGLANAGNAPARAALREFWP